MEFFIDYLMGFMIFSFQIGSLFIVLLLGFLYGTLMADMLFSNALARNNRKLVAGFHLLNRDDIKLMLMGMAFIAVWLIVEHFVPLEYESIIILGYDRIPVLSMSIILMAGFLQLLLNTEELEAERK